MPKIQGKQIAKSTISQELLNLTTPLSGDTLSGATVGYVNSAIDNITVTVDNGLTDNNGVIGIGGNLTGDTKLDLSSNTLAIKNLNTGLDTSSGFNQLVDSLVVQPDGKIITVGTFTSYSGTPMNYIARINPDGTFDTSFNSGGTGFGSGNPDDVNLQSDGKIITVGNYTTYNGTTTNRITRLNTDGTLDTSFVTGTGFDVSDIEKVEVASDDSLFIGGGFSTYSGVTANNFIKLNSNGTIDSAFLSNLGTGFNDVVYDIKEQSDNKIIVVGNFTTFDGDNVSRVVRLNADGTLDGTFEIVNDTNGFDNNILTVDIQSDGKYIFGGNFTDFSGTTLGFITRFNINGTIDTSFVSGSTFDSRVNKIVVLPDDKILVGGQFTTALGTPYNRIAKLNADGTLDTTFEIGTGFNLIVYDMELYKDYYIVGGQFTTFNGTDTRYLASLYPNGALNNTSIERTVTFDGNVAKYGGDYSELFTDNTLITKKYVDDTISGSTGFIGEAEDGTYTDGIFTDFTPSTPIGTAVDRFNEVLLLLAPTPPNSDWTNVFSNLNITSTEYSARALTSGVVVNNITTDTTPNFSTSVSIPTQGMNGDIGTFTMSDTSGTLDTVTLTTGDDTTSGIISLTESDPYFGESGKAGFWSGITAMSVSGTITAPITPSATQRTLTFTHPGGDSPETYNYYVDNAITPTVGTVTAIGPSMTGNISGVPTLVGGETISGIVFSVTNAVSYFYNNSFYDITGSLVNNDTANAPTTIPTTQDQSVTESGLTAIVTSSSVYSESLTFNVTARSANGTSDNNTWVDSDIRIDTVSNESLRLTSGTGSYPGSGYGSVFDSSQSLVGIYTDELQLLNGTYQYPTNNYTAYSGPDYSSATGTRWATFNLGSFNNNSAFTLTINGASGIGSIIGNANLLLEIKIEGSSSWVDGDAAYSGTGDPGSGIDGVAAVVVGSSSATSKRITFGTAVHTGNIIVRIGLTSGSSITFTSLSASSIV